MGTTVVVIFTSRLAVIFEVFVFIPRINSYDKKELLSPNGLCWLLLLHRYLIFCSFSLGISYLAEFIVLVFERRWIILADNQIYIQWSRALQPKDHTYYANRLKLSFLLFRLFLHFDLFKIVPLSVNYFLFCLSTTKVSSFQNLQWIGLEAHWHT